MNSSIKTLLVSSLVVGLGGLIYYVVSKGGAGKGLIGKKGKIDYIGIYKVNNLSGKWIHLQNEDRIRLKGKVQRGDVATINGTPFDDKYEVKSIWIDTNGNLGAVLLSPDIPYSPKSTKDISFKGSTIKFN
jgi:hypothetical protein